MTTVDLLETPIEYLKGVGPKKAGLFKKEFNIITYNDLLHYYPYRHIDKTTIHQIRDLTSEGAYLQFKGSISSYEILGDKRARRLVANFSDNTETLKLVWFNSIKWVENLLQEKRDFIVFGKPTLFNRSWNITHPELLDPKMQEQSDISLSFQPLYNTSEIAKRGGLDSRNVAKLVITLLGQIQDVIQESLPDEMLQQYRLITRKDALVNIHYPKNNDLLSKAMLRIKFDELFFTQLKLLKAKLINEQKNAGYLFAKVGDFFNTYYKKYIPYELTNAQKRVIKEIRADLGSGKQMNRLLQGDVGSGKTITALLIMLIAIDNGYQSCIMAPTEILAAQHFESISNMLKEMKIRIALLTGSTKSKDRKQLLADLQNGDIDILVGTHALIEDTVIFKNLGLAIIDEQHRFGVEQRAKLWKKNILPPHILVMTATPIPRTLAMTLYGDLNLSVIDELPLGRKPIITKHFYAKDRLRLFGIMEEEIKEGRQVFVVYPLIQESEKMDLFDLMAGYDLMSQRFPLPYFAIGIVHGKMKAEEKDYEMQRFAKNQTQILLSTTVIEVGINIPNATMMVIENAERFGLSQLHQLRGRVGRGGDQSYCILMTDNKLTTESKQRIQAMVSTNDGFEIANFDLKLRGPGDIEGTQQSGIIDFKMADLAKDEKLVVFTRQLAMQILNADPELADLQNKRIRNYLQKIMQQNNSWGKIS